MPYILPRCLVFIPKKASPFLMPSYIPNSLPWG